MRTLPLQELDCKKRGVGAPSLLHKNTGPTSRSPFGGLVRVRLLSLSDRPERLALLAG
jgi:hypothetical protein